MAIIECSECGNQVSDKALTCPRCGIASPISLEEKKANKKIESIIQSLIFLIPLLIAVYIVGCISKNNQSNTPVEHKVQTPAEQMNSAFGGNNQHWDLRTIIKASMHNPNSYDFVSGKRWESSGEYFTSITYRGTNAFGGIVTNEVVAKLTETGKIISISQ